MDEIRVDPEELMSLKSKVSGVSSELSEVQSSFDADLSQSPTVAMAYYKFTKQWDEKRNNLVESLDSVANALQTVHDSFVETDAEIARAANEPATD